jgi:hypothetical protein
VTFSVVPGTHDHANALIHVTSQDNGSTDARPKHAARRPESKPESRAMKKITTLLFAATMLMLAGGAEATSYSVESFDVSKHSVWVRNYQEHLHFDPAGSLMIEADQWTLTGSLVSGDDGSLWSISVVFDHVMTGDHYKAFVGTDDAAIKGNTWANQQADWAFARDISGTLTKLSGPDAGLTYSLERFASRYDYWAQFGTGLNDKNGLLGMSSWLNLRLLDEQGALTDTVYRGDINLNASLPVPEPSAALAFGAGSLVVAATIRRRNR